MNADGERNCMANDSRLELNQITEKIIGAAFEVSKVMGSGFLEKVYENSLMHELSRRGMHVCQQYAIDVYYDDIVAGEYIADIMVEDKVIVELKAVKELNDVHMAQCMNYLHATGLHICLLLNFGRPRVEVKRIVRDF